MSCRDGHPNPEGAAFCATCGQSLAPRAPGAGATPTSGTTRLLALAVGAVLLVVVAVTVTVLLTGSDDGDATAPPVDGAAAEGPAVFTVSGTLALVDDDMRNPSFDRILYRCDFDDTCSQPAGEPCAAGGAGYSDIEAGAQVTVTDQEGTVLAVGALGEGVTPHTPDVWAGDSDYPPCLFPFTITDVPETGSIYGVEVSHRGVLQFDRDDAAALSFSLGD